MEGCGVSSILSLQGMLLQCMLQCMLLQCKLVRLCCKVLQSFIGMAGVPYRGLWCV